MHDLVVHGAAMQRVRMANHGKARRRRQLRVFKQGLEHPGWAIDLQLLGARRTITQGFGAPENPSAAELMQ